MILLCLWYGFDMLLTSFFLWCVSCDMFHQFHHFPFWPVLQTRHSESASKGSVVLVTAPKQHCNVEWFHPPKGRKDYWHTKIYVCFFVCVCCCVSDAETHMWYEKWLQYPTLVPWCGALFCFAWRVQALLAWSGAPWIAWSRDGCFNFTWWFATMDQPKKTRHVINDIQHTINLLDGWCCGVLPIL